MAFLAYNSAMLQRLVLTGIGVLSLIAPALASFDMMIVPDGSGDGFRRFDPINRVSLGTVNAGTGRFVAATASRNFGYYTNASGVMAIDNSTGERLSIPTFSTVPTAWSRDGSRLAVSFGTSTSFYSPLANGLFGTASGNFFNPAGFTFQGIAAASGNRWVIYGTSATGLDVYTVSSTGSIISSALGAILPANLSASSIGQGVVVTRSATGQETLALPYRDATGTHRLLYASFPSTGVFGGFSSQVLSGYSLANSFTTLSAVSGHTGFFVVGGDLATPTSTRITEFDDVSAFIPVQSYATSSLSPVLGSRWTMSNVVAPEPGTMIALGAGIAALLRRKKVKSA